MRHTRSVKGGLERQQLGPNWRPQQMTHWRKRGIEVLGPSATEILLLIMDGTDTILKLSAAMDMSVSAITGHVRRMQGMGLVMWVRGEPIQAFMSTPWMIDSADEPIDYELTQQAHDLLAGEDGGNSIRDDGL